MKRYAYFVALLGLVVLTSCSADSPDANPLPTVVPEAWSITSLTVDPADPAAGDTVVVEAVVTKDGSDAPDGTQVTFSATNGGFANTSSAAGSAALSNPANIPTSGGTSTAYFVASAGGTIVIQAKVKSVTRSITVEFEGGGGGGSGGGDETLAIYEVNPRIGSFDGGETVYLRGRGIAAPVDVVFIVEGQRFTAEVTSVNSSNPPSNGNGEITLLTPYISGAEIREENREADIEVTKGTGTPDEEMYILPAGFTFSVGGSGGGPSSIFGVEPRFGKSSGGDNVTILGRNLEDAEVVSFGFRGNELVADIVSVAPDGLQVSVITPRFSATPIDENELASVTVINDDGERTTLTDAFVVVADEPQPQIASFAPIAGPLDGGTLVTIFGSGFQVPIQVRFGDLAATDVNVYDDQSIADNDRITCLSPDYSQQEVEPPHAVDITVTNMTTGKSDVLGSFTYGDNLFISGNSPAEGGADAEVTIFGSGFEDPLQLEFGGTRMDVIAVSGTQIRAKFPVDMAVACGDQTSSFTVTLLESNQQADGGSFTLRGNQPRVVSVAPTTLDVVGVPPSALDPDEITISGSNFAQDVVVEIAGVTIPGSDVSVTGDNSIFVNDLPVPGMDFSLVYDTTSCVATGDVPGEREVATAVSVSVTNFPGSCRDTLVGGLIFDPGMQPCVAISPEPDITTSPPDGGVLDLGTVAHDPGPPLACTTEQFVTINNVGTADLTVAAAIAGTDPGEFTISTSPSTPVAMGDTTQVGVQFCPTADDGLARTAELRINSNDPDNGLVTINLQGLEQP
jgi:hypothetical protein